MFEIIVYAHWVNQDETRVHKCGKVPQLFLTSLSFVN